MRFIENIKNIGAKVKRKIEKIFGAKDLNKRARKSGFVKRATSKIQGKDFIELTHFYDLVLSY
ncbi:hypothetical protein GMMP15_990004 [Candidatus Magnetomoraceae bacterium gMMP-15]